MRTNSGRPVLTVILTGSVILTGFVALLCTPAFGGDWAQWRGPNGNGIAEAGQGVPTEWSRTTNVVWRVDVPGRGHSSPTIVGDRITLTTADEPSQTQAVICFDRSTGKQLWLTPVSQGGFPKLHHKNTHASSTVASDGRLFFAVFNHHLKVEAVALDADGKIVWKQDVGGFNPRLYEYGYASSPTVYGDTLIVTGNSDTISWMKALNTRTGKIVWEQDMPKGLVWSSPIVADVAGRKQLLLSGFESMSAFDPADGQRLWSTPCLTLATCGTAVWEDGVVFASGGYPKAETVAIRADGSGKILWQNGVKCYEQSLLAAGGHVYAFSDQGIAYCWNAETGREMWKTRLKGPVSASPILAGDLIFASNELGTTFVFRASPDSYQPVARNQLGDESFASPTIVDGRIYLRVADSQGSSRRESLYCIGRK